MNGYDFDLSYDEISELIDQWILNEQHRSILKRRLLDEIKFEPLAEEFKLSVRQVKRIVYRGEMRILKHIK